MLRFFLFFLFLCTHTFAQRGNLLVKNYKLPSVPQTTDIVQNSKGILYFAHSGGILSYDGFRWDDMNLDVNPHSLAIDNKDVLYVGGKGFFGKIEPSKTGKLDYFNLSYNQKETGDITDIFIQESQVLFYSSKGVFSYTNNEVKILYKTQKDELNGWAVLKDEVFVNVADKGFCRISNGNLIQIRQDFSEKTILSFIPFNQQNLLLATDDNILWMFDGKSLFPFPNYATEYLQNHFLEKMTDLSPQEFAISTLAGGVIIVNKKDGSISQIINYETGLADNEISAVLADKHQGLWICHTEGISRVPLNVPVYNYGHYPGIEGKPSTIIKIKDLLYVGTNSGLFYLSYSNKDDVSGQVAAEKQRQLQQIAWQRAQNRKRNLIQKLNSLKKSEDKTPKIVTVVVESNVYNYNYSNYLLEKTPYNFRKINGVEGKCKQLIQFQDKLIALTNTGLYEVQFGIATQILEDRNLLYVEFSKLNPNLLYVATHKGVFILEKTPKGWLNTPIADIQDTVFNLAQYENNLWIAGEGRIWKIKLNTQGQPSKTISYTLENKNVKVVVRAVQNELLFFTNFGVLKKVQMIGDIFLPDSKWQQYNLQNSKLYTHQDTYTWGTEGLEYKELGGKPINSSQYLSIIPDIQNIYYDNQKNLWAVNSDGVYRIYPQEGNKSNTPDLFIKQVQSGNGTLLQLEKTAIESNGSIQNFHVQIASPFFIAEENTQFQYYLKGLDESDWSPWKNQAWIEFPYLPSGEYVLKYRSKNTLGQVSPTQTFIFEVKAPFWQTWWFYIIQIGILFGLLLAAVIYNRKGAESRVATVITLVAIITVFELLFLLIEPLIDDFSGGVFIFKLLVNILLAVSLIPMEKKIQQYLQNSEYLDSLSQKLGWKKRLKDIGEYLNVQQIKDIAKNRRQD
ncbi:MAG: hypothetical protein MUC49_08525 [Raineya sp.]|jgi:ligand-binding sensor domain-containing protein|nr:hypothetical protein [Raineya sp.]